jgi:hypothetical protein
LTGYLTMTNLGRVASIVGPYHHMTSPIASLIEQPTARRWNGAEDATLLKPDVRAGRNAY